MPNPLPPSDVRLLPGPLAEREELNAKYLLSLDPERLVHSFRVTAGLTSSATPYGGWESPECGLRGHFVGHFLSACAYRIGRGDDRFVGPVGRLVGLLAECQSAHGDGYLSAFPATEFDTLERTLGGAWAPYYTLHKVLAGLIEAGRALPGSGAMEVAKGLGGWVVRRIGAVPASRLDALLRTSEPNPLNEFGGMGEALYDLYAATGDEVFLRTGKVFDREWFVTPLAEGRDELTGLHSNTHVAQALALSRRHEVTGERWCREAAEFFWGRVVLGRTYANGGSSGPRPGGGEKSPGAEHWPVAGRLDGTLTPKINESCVVLNLLRLTDRLYGWEGRAEYAEYRERAFVNSVLSLQHPGRAGAYLYHHPLSAGSVKAFGSAESDFWCCYGTAVEAYARLGEGAFHDDRGALAVAQYVPARVRFGGGEFALASDFPRGRRATLEYVGASPVRAAVRLRIPAWADSAACDAADARREPGGFVLDRQWRTGDRVAVSFNAGLHAEALPGDGLRFAVFDGPVLLAARTERALQVSAAGDVAPDAAMLTDGTRVPVVPVHEITDGPFGVYFEKAGGVSGRG